MMTMKIDMSGAAAVLCAMSVLPELAAPVKVTGYLCLAENMLSGRAIRPGDVLRIAGLMGNNDALLEQVRAAGERAGEQFWRLPLPPEYRKDLESEIADLK